MRRWLLQPVVWFVDTLAYFCGQLLDESIDLLNLTEDEAVCPCGVRDAYEICRCVGGAPLNP